MHAFNSTPYVLKVNWPTSMKAGFNLDLLDPEHLTEIWDWHKKRATTKLKLRLEESEEMEFQVPTTTVIWKPTEW